MYCRCGKQMIWLVSNKDSDTAFWCRCGICCINHADGKNPLEWHIPEGYTGELVEITEATPMYGPC